MNLENKNITDTEHSPTLPLESQSWRLQRENEREKGLRCPNCGGVLEGRKCKLFCTTRGCGYLVTCSEW